MITVRHMAAGRVETLAADAAAALLRRRPPGVVWIDLVGQDRDVRELLGELDLGEWIVEDMLQTSTYPKAEAWPSALFLVVSGIDVDTEGDRFELETMELDAVLGDGWLITHTEAPLEVIARATVALERDVAAVSTPAELLHLILDCLVDEYEPFIDRFIPDRIDMIEELLFSDCAEPWVRQEIYLRRRDVQRLQRVARPQAAAVRRLASLSSDAGAGQEHLFRDIADRLDYVAGQTESLRGQLNAAFDHFQSIVSHSQNEIMKVLTMVSATLLPITVITGIYGMNFRFMPELNERWGYPSALAAMAVVLVASFSYFRAKGWIGRPQRPVDATDTLQMALGRVLRTPALGARAVTRTAGRATRGATRRARRLVRTPPPR